ncbi:hypothetical protein DTO217A2_7565 [Paecilomyces variotii]|nr:hypothetical protein DTO217A2_7565 [Paecilomyces variotii]
MPRLVRRQPLAERVKAYLNPLDFLLWLSEEIDSSDWEQWEKEWALPIGAGLNFIFLVARANSARKSRAEDHIFGDDGGVSWLTWVASFIVHFLALISAVNAFYTFWRKRRYRMFEASIDKVPSTPSAHRVRVDSSPASPTPLRFLSNVLSAGSAESRAHPDPQRDVWEIAVWDPSPLALRLFCLFSPGHVLIYWLFLPTLPSDPRPSVTIVTTIFLVILLSIQMSLLSGFFSQQAKDSALVHKEVLNEYDAKFVHPRIQPLMRDVGTQFSGYPADSGSDDKYNKVDVFTPRHVIRRGFTTSPNPNYVRHVDPEGISRTPARRQSPATPSVSSSVSLQHSSLQTPSHLRDASPFKSASIIRQPQFRPSTGSGDGGSLGVYSHANSPLRKPSSTYLDRRSQPSGIDPTGLSPVKRQSSPLKRSSVPAGVSTAAAVQRWGHLSSNPDSPRRESGRF